jgi:hypothetical protein
MIQLTSVPRERSHELAGCPILAPFSWRKGGKRQTSPQPPVPYSLFFSGFPQNYSATHGLHTVAVPDKILSADNYPRGSHNRFTLSSTISAEAMCPGLGAGRLDSCKRQKTP